MAGIGLAQIQPAHADMNKVPMGDDGKPSVAVMTLPNGKVVWKRKLIRAKHEPELGADGKQVWALHPTTAQPLYKRYIRRRAERDQMFTMESDGHMNIYTQDYYPPSPEEQERAERALAMQQKQAAFFDALGRSNISPEGMDSLIAVLAGQGDEEVEAPEFPKKAAGVGQWLLSDGSKFKGKKAEAEAAEAAIIPAT